MECLRAIGLSAVNFSMHLAPTLFTNWFYEIGYLLICGSARCYSGRLRNCHCPRSSSCPS